MQGIHLLDWSIAEDDCQCSMYACIHFSHALIQPVGLHSWLHLQGQKWTSAQGPFSSIKQIFSSNCIFQWW